MTDRVVIVGGGQAGQSVVETLRKEGFEGEITLVCDEPVRPYQRPPLSKKYLLGEWDLERLFFKPEGYYAETAVDLRLRTAAAAIDTAARSVNLADGEVVRYGHLVLATGSRARLLPAAIGGDLGNVFPVRNLTDVHHLSAALEPGRRVLIVGGGYIGLEAAAVMSKLGLEATLIEAAPRILQRVAAEATSDYFRELHESRGVSVREGVGLDRLTGQGVVREAHLEDGSVMPVDLVIVGIGIQPNTELAEGAGITCGNGIVVDSACRTSAQGVLAAGDCASFSWRGRRIRLESVQNAVDQAAAAASTILGRPADYRPVPWFWSDQYEIKLQIAGLSQGHDRVVARPGARDGSLSIWYYAGDELIAVDAMNEPRAYMLGKRWLEQGESPPAEAVADPAIDLKTL